jgi:hypothetical protein
MKRVENTSKADHLSMLFAAMNIPAQEKQGQQQIINSTQLPKKYNYGDAMELYQKMGITVVGVTNSDDLFYDVTLPEGWKKKATGHDMWNDLLDEKGRKRAMFFYKAAFYDRDAFISPERRFRIETQSWLSEEEKGHYETVNVERLNPDWQRIQRMNDEEDEDGYRYTGFMHTGRLWSPVSKYIIEEKRMWVSNFKNTYDEDNHTSIIGRVYDGNELLFEFNGGCFTRKYRKDRHEQWWKAYEEFKHSVYQKCETFLIEKGYPEWKDFFAYWD